MQLVDPSILDLRSEGDVVEVIKRFTGDLEPPQIGIGDDAALVKVGETWLALTLDTMVEGVHFLLDGVASWYDVGWKLAASNLSDLAAMGAVPLHALVGLTTTRDVSSSDIADLYRGFQAAMSKFGGIVVGGDTVVADRVAVSIALTGIDVDPLTVFSLDAAVPGDSIALSGTVGDSRAGLETISTRGTVFDSCTKYLIDRHLRPTPRIALREPMIAHGIRCATDVSDGLVKDLEKICGASRTVATVDVDSIPISQELTCAFPDRALEFALSGGEDYELLVTGDRARIISINESVSAEPGRTLTIIGEMSEPCTGRDSASDATKVHLRSTKSDQSIPSLKNTGWDHWSAAE